MKRSSRIWVWVVSAALLAGACSSAGRFAGKDNPAFRAFNEAIRLYETRDFIAAREMFSAILTNHPDSPVYPSSLYHIAEIEYFLGNYRSGLGYIDEFLESFPQYELVLAAQVLNSYILVDLGEIKKSIVVLEGIVKDYPGSKEAPLALLLLAEVAHHRGDYAQAEVLLQRIIKEYPDSPQAETARYRIDIMPQYKYHDDDRYIPDDPMEGDVEVSS